MNISIAPFGITAKGKEATLFTLCAGDCRLLMTDYGATMLSFLLPKGGGAFDDILLGFDTLREYEKSDAYFGATVGRFANRIAGARFSLHGKEFQLAANNGPNHLHGGLEGFDRKIWKAQPFESHDSVGLHFELESPDGEEGYPGNLRIEASYTLSSDARIEIDFQARCDQDTIIGLTQHAYFNLRGRGQETVLDHLLQLKASRYLPVDGLLIPTGEAASVEKSPFDFREIKPIGRDLEKVGGYDHCFVIDRPSGRINDSSYQEFARLLEPQSARSLVVSTTLPGVQLYTGNFLEGIKGKSGCLYKKHSGLCLETEVFPDSPNRPGFEGSLLKRGEVWAHRTTYQAFY